jgi:autophagy-related protein 9
MNWSALGTGLTEDALNGLAGVPKLARRLCCRSCTRWYRHRLLAASGRTDDSLEMAYLFDDTQGREDGPDTVPQQQPPHHAVLSDGFLKHMYGYFHRGGFIASVVHTVGNLVVYAFTMVLIVVVVLGIDWAVLWDSHSARGQDVVAYLRDPVRVLLRGPGRPWHAAMYMCLCAAAVLWTWMAAVSVLTLRGLWKMRQFYHHKLRLRNLHGVKWPAVVQALQGGPPPSPKAPPVHPPSDLDRLLADDGSTVDAAVVARPLDPGLDSACEHVAQRVMRQDNYVIALYADGVLGAQLRWTQSLVWGLHVTLVDWMVTGPTVRPDVLHTTVGAARKLARRFKLLAAVSALCVLLLLPFMALHLLLRASQDVHAKREAFGPRTWTTAATWACRGFNELPHCFARRMAGAHAHARAYVHSATSPAVSEAAAVVSYIIAAALTVVLAILAVAAEADNLTLGGRTLVWYTAMLAGALAASRQFVQDPTTTTTTTTTSAAAGGTNFPADDCEPARLLWAVQQHVHGLPEQWLEAADTPATRTAFGTFFRNRALVLWDELAGFAALPYVFGVVLPPRAPAIVAWVSAHTVVTPGLGHVCLDTRNPGSFP